MGLFKHNIKHIIHGNLSVPKLVFIITLLITLACLKENLLLNIENMKEVFMIFHTTIMAIPRSILAFMPS